jgi:chemotaxis protein CheD
MLVTEEVCEHFLFPNTIYVSKKPARIQTILGSCVAVCLFDMVLGYGAINHYMLPWWNGEGIPSPKYGDIAVMRLIESMVHLGCRKENIVAKIFGGADQLTIGKIGEKNIATAELILERESVSIIARSTGGIQGRKIVFYTDTNKVMLKYLVPNQPTHEKN